MAPTFDEIITLLQREPLFQGLSREQVDWAASQFQPITLERNTVVFSQGAAGDFFYIVLEGRVHAVRSVKGRETPQNLLGPGDFFGEEALLFGDRRQETYITVGKTNLLRVDVDGFYHLLEAFPRLQKKIAATANSRRLARKRRFQWQDSEEVVYFLTRRHDLFLLLGLLLPILLGVGAVPVLAFALANSDKAWTLGLSLGGGAVMALAALGWGAWNLIDWSNDFYIVTNRRVLWTEKVVGLYESRREAPLDTVLAVDVSSGLLGRLLHYGDVTVRTYIGGITMRRVRHADLLAAFIEGYKRRAEEISKEEEAREIQRALESALAQGGRPATDIDTGPANPAGRRADPPRGPGLSDAGLSPGEIWKNFFTVRYVQGDMITYRKHWFLLLLRTWQPLLALLVVLGGTAGLLYAHYIAEKTLLSPLATGVVGGVLLLVAGAWLGYQYLDWSNDIYRLTPDQILDIERKPLGQEIKKTAPLESILSMEHKRDNLLGILLNFGTVTINVGESQFVFRGVYNPDQVHHDISAYREALNRKKRADQKKRERKRMVKWLVSYHQQTGTFPEGDGP